MKRDSLAVLVVVIFFIVFMFIIFNISKNQYNNYKVDEPNLIIECDDVFYVVNDDTYVCFNSEMVYEFTSDFNFDDNELYTIERYYTKVSFFRWVATDIKTVERIRIVLRSD